jgi:MvaI/BcnI restriction endonuclease family
MQDAPFIYTKERLVERFKEIAAAGWIASARHGNQGGIGNTLEDPLEIMEGTSNNRPLSNRVH